jgi:hypothetical protein
LSNFKKAIKNYAKARGGSEPTIFGVVGNAKCLERNNNLSGLHKDHVWRPVR